jgi:hypothetical protein
VALNALSKQRLRLAHPLLQKIMNLAAVNVDFLILDSMRGEAEQELAFKRGYTKVHFGNSAHNWKPALALDIAPEPLDWGNSKNKAHNVKALQRFVDLQLSHILPAAMKLGIKIRQGVDWNRNGNLTDDSWDDLPHVEIHPWREYAKSAQLYRGK